MAKLPLEIWSDIACPWCYIGKRRLETALDTNGRRDTFEITWRAFELNPGSPRVLESDLTQAERLAKKYGRSLTDAKAMVQRVVDAAAGEGLDFDFDHVKPGNTFDGHRLIHLGRHHGIEDTVKERMLKAYLCDGEAIGDLDTLHRLGVEAGLPAAEVADTLASDLYTIEIRAEEREASELGIRGVPFFVINRRYGVSGAQSADVLGEALDKALEEARPVMFAEGAVCGPDGC
jgi:predicted DsbA family dithiol-disulfide isomerase